jgi:hypothetical protein
MSYIIENINNITLLKSKDKDIIVKKLKENSVDYLKNIDAKLNELTDIQFRIMLSQEVDKLFNIYKYLNEHNSKNKLILKMYTESYLSTYNILENKYKPFIKEAFKQRYEFWTTRESSFYNENLWRAYRNESKSVVENSNLRGWHYVFIAIIKGEINIVKKDNYSYKYFYENKEFESPSEIGNKIAEKLSRKENSIRPILTDSINGGKSKNIFIKDNLKKMNELIEIHGNEMCDFFKEKFEKLI